MEHNLVDIDLVIENGLQSSEPGSKNLYDSVIEAVEKPLFMSLMSRFNHNQTKVANALGLNRGTTRKKLKQYGLID